MTEKTDLVVAGTGHNTLVAPADLSPGASAAGLLEDPEVGPLYIGDHVGELTPEPANE